jgi:hypothetical protein
MYSPRILPSTSPRTHRRDQMRAATPRLRPRRLDIGVLEVPGQECRHAVRVAHVDRDQPAPLRRVGMVPRRPSGLRARDTDQPMPRGIQTPAHSAPVRSTNGRQVVVQADPGLRITGPAGVRDGQRRRQSPDEFVTVGHERTFERMLRTPKLGPTGSDGGRNVPGTDETPKSSPWCRASLLLRSASGPAAVGCEHQADVAQLVEHRHGKAGVKGSSPFVGSPFSYRNVTAVRYHFCPRLSPLSARRGRQITSTGVKMALDLAIGRLGGPLMVRMRSRVRFPTSACRLARGPLVSADRSVRPGAGSM